ncbi:LTA synthase family protein [Mycetohabitans sp. B8]|nr:LTA synthase family protein [Mycetohabitans sp. B8]
MMRSLRFARSALLVLMVGSISFEAFRIAYLLYYGGAAQVLDNVAETLHALWIGWRFDLRVLSIAILGGLLPVFVVTKWRPLKRAAGLLQRLSIAAILLCVNLGSACQFYYYDFYGSPFNPMVFGLLGADPWGTLAAARSQYPVVRCALLMALVTAVQMWVILRLSGSARIDRNEQARPRERMRCVLDGAVLVVLLLGLARGGLGESALDSHDAQISSRGWVNDSVRNAAQALYDAYVDRRSQARIDEDPACQLARYGFRSTDELARAVGAASGAPPDLESVVFRRTPENRFLAAHPPHVVFALMESWGAHPLEFSTASIDVAGVMAEHLQSDYLFHNVFPARLGGHAALEALLLNSPVSPLTQGDQGFVTYSTSAALPFKTKGYRTVFVYGGIGAWRSVARTMRRQNFDEVYDMAAIIGRYPDAKRTIWGVYDEYLFRFAFDLLATRDALGQKIFLFVMSTTNRPPHTVPSHYLPPPLDLSDMRRHFAADFDKGSRMMQTYQYATHQLGMFISRVEAAPFGSKTIVAATGDHPMRGLFRYQRPEQSRELYRVPGFFRVPPRYRPSFVPDLQRYAGHADFFPTLYHLALSDARYPAFGHSLFAPAAQAEQFAVINFKTMFSRDGAMMPLVGEPAAFRWQQPTYALVPDDAPSALLSEQAARARARIALADWYVRYQVIRARTGEGY